MASDLDVGLVDVFQRMGEGRAYQVCYEDGYASAIRRRAINSRSERSISRAHYRVAVIDVANIVLPSIRLDLAERTTRAKLSLGVGAVLFSHGHASNQSGYSLG
jgi:hypothetical protein